jgi:hypothetical protein
MTPQRQYPAARHQHQYPTAVVSAERLPAQFASSVLSAGSVRATVNLLVAARSQMLTRSGSCAAERQLQN